MINITNNTISEDKIKLYLGAVIDTLITDRVDPKCLYSDVNDINVTLEQNAAIISYTIYVCDKDTENELITSLDTNSLQTDIVNKINGDDEREVTVIGDPIIQYTTISSDTPDGADSSNGTDMIVWMSKAGLTAPVEEDDVVFVEAENAYAAVRVAWGGFTWRETELPAEIRDRLGRLAPAGAFNTTRFIPENATMVLNEEYSPVILEVMAKGDIESFDAFKAKVKGCEMRMDAAILRYTTIYGDDLTFDTSFVKTPSINGKR